MGWTVDDLRLAFAKAWSLASSTKWTPDNPASGQCGVTALVAQDYLGGDILKTRHCEAWHFYNRVDEVAIDFTASQFEAPIAYGHELSERAEAFDDTSLAQYDALRSAVQRGLAGHG